MSIKIFVSSVIIVHRMVIITYMHKYAFNKKICYVLDNNNIMIGVRDISEEISH